MAWHPQGLLSSTSPQTGTCSSEGLPPQLSFRPSRHFADLILQYPNLAMRWCGCFGTKDITPTGPDEGPRPEKPSTGFISDKTRASTSVPRTESPVLEGVASPGQTVPGVAVLPILGLQSPTPDLTLARNPAPPTASPPEVGQNSESAGTGRMIAVLPDLPLQIPQWSSPPLEKQVPHRY